MLFCFFTLSRKHQINNLSTLTTETTGEGDITGLDGDTLSMESAEVGVTEETGGIGLSGFLAGSHGGCGPAETFLVAGGELTDEAGEGSFAAKEGGALLELLDLTKSDGAWAPAEGFLLGLLLGLLDTLLAFLGGLVDGSSLCARHLFGDEIF